MQYGSALTPMRRNKVSYNWARAEGNMPGKGNTRFPFIKDSCGRQAQWTHEPPAAGPGIERVETAGLPGNAPVNIRANPSRE
jgi:hypothetical protein